MKNRILRYSIIFIISFISFCIGYITSGTIEGNEYRKTEKLKIEAQSFFYKTIREIYAGTYGPENEYVGESTLKSFNTDEFRAKFNPVCHLGWLDVKYGDSFYGWLYCQSGEVYEVEIQKINSKWMLNQIRLNDNKKFWYDLREDK